MSPLARALLLLLLLGAGVRAEPGVLTVSPASPPRNLLRWQLLPSLLDQKPGDPLALYKQAREALRDAEPGRDDYREIALESERLAAADLSAVSRPRVTAIVTKFQKALDLVAVAANCERIDWTPQLDRIRKQGINTLLPEVQEVREFMPYLRLQARHHLFADRPEEAVRVAALVFAIARQFNESPTLISHLVAIALATTGVGILEDCVQHPRCPCLYDSLTALPRPLLPLRHAFEGARVMGHATLPGLEQMRANPTAELDGETIDRLLAIYRELLNEEPRRIALAALDRLTFGAALKQKHPAASAALRAAGYDAATVARMPVLNVGIVHAFLQYEEGLGQMATAAQRPYHEARTELAEIAKRWPPRRERVTAPDDAAFPLARLLLPAGDRILLADLRLNRRLELLRATEALRRHAVRSGTWPERLADVAGVPHDPATGQPFAYHRAGTTATLDAPRPRPDAAAAYALRFRLTLRAEEVKP